MVLKKHWKSIAWILIILILSSISGNDLKKIPRINIPHFDKLVHFGMYFILSTVLVFDFSKIQKVNFKLLFYIFLFSVSYGILMEFMQEYVFIKRSASFYDSLANTVGSVVALISMKFYLKKATKY